jgi:hypothetical protein
LKKESSDDPVLFFPKALNIVLSGRSSDLSRFPEAFPPRFLFQKTGQWQVIRKPSSLKRSGITAAGTVADSDRIPFSLPRFYFRATPKRDKYTLYMNPADQMALLNMNRY